MNSILPLILTSSDDDSDQEYPPRRDKTFRLRINYENFQGHDFKERFRIYSDEAEYLLSRIGHHLKHTTSKNKALSPSQQLLTALHWFGNGGQYHLTSDAHGISKSTVCRSVHRVVEAIVNHLFQDIVKWPDDTSKLPSKFLELGGFPSVCGIADGTLINIDAPTNNEAAYVDRYGIHSINALGICGPDYTFYFFSSRWPGSVNDNRVLRNSHVCTRFNNGWRPFPNAVLLGDSGYGLKEWLIPPLNSNPFDRAEQRFNSAHKSTRRMVEMSFGILKERFSCLNYLRVNPEFAGKIIMACVAIHNISSKEDYLFNNYASDTFDAPGPVTPISHAPTAAARARLQDLIAFFR